MKKRNILLISVIGIAWMCLLIFAFLSGLKKIIKPAPKSRKLDSQQIMRQQRRINEQTQRQQKQHMEQQRRRMRDINQQMEQQRKNN